MIDKFEAYETEATFTRGNKMTTQVVAMDDIRTIVADIAEELANDVDTEKEALHIDSVMPRFSEITKDSDDGAFSWILKNNINADHPENNSDMIRRLVHKYNDLVKFLNRA
jgi:hypothetical protein